MQFKIGDRVEYKPTSCPIDFKDNIGTIYNIDIANDLCFIDWDYANRHTYSIGNNDQQITNAWIECSRHLQLAEAKAVQPINIKTLLFAK